MKHVKDWEIFRFTDKNGKMKSGTVVYSISFAALFLIIYGAAYYFLIDLLNALLKNSPIWLSDIISALVPALAGSVICALTMKITEAKKTVFLAYIWLGAFAVVFFIAMLIMLWDDKDALTIFLRLFIIIVPAPILIGGALTRALYRRREEKRGEYDD